MGYAIVGGSGLIMGIALLIWGLRERNLRFAYRRARDQAENVAFANKKVCEDLREQNLKYEDEVAILKTRLEGLREILKKSGNKEAIHAWLDSETEEEEL